MHCWNPATRYRCTACERITQSPSVSTRERYSVSCPRRFGSDDRSRNWRRSAVLRYVKGSARTLWGCEHDHAVAELGPLVERLGVVLVHPYAATGRDRQSELID